MRGWLLPGSGELLAFCVAGKCHAIIRGLRTAQGARQMQIVHSRHRPAEAARRPANANADAALRLKQAKWAIHGYEFLAQMQMEKALKALRLVDECRAEIMAAELELERAKG